MASGTRTRARKSGSQATAVSPNTTKKWKKKAHRVEAGDIIQLHTPNPHMFGNVGTVVGYVTAHEVLVRTFGGNDTDYPPMYISAFDREPNPNYTDPANKMHGHQLHNYGTWISSVIHRINPQGQKKRKRAPVRFLRVNPNAVPDLLTGELAVDRGVHVVLDDTATAPEHIVAQP